ncbi:MAG: DUF4178 domain-containing protein [Acidobacteriota bacterium]
MDGEPEIVTPPPIPAARPTGVKTFHCPGCGSPLTVRGMSQTESLACGSCGSIIDISNESFRIIETYRARIRHEPLIPLGARGKLRGDLFEVIGYMRRGIEVEGVPYEWSEYLLFNPYKGFRWLTEYNGHWNYVKTTTHIPKAVLWSDQPAFDYLGQRFLHFQTARATVNYVLGEFYWKVQVGQACQVSDFVAPPLILSREVSDDEITWSIGEYLDPESLRRSFQLTSSLPSRSGIAPNQPSPFSLQTPKIKVALGYFLLAVVLIQILVLLLSQNRLVYQNEYAYHQSSSEKSRVTDVFELSGRPSNVVVATRANVDNNWMYLSMALINDQNGVAYDFGREISHYHGRDSDGAWTEGSITDKAVLPSVPSGRYYLRIEPESPASHVSYSIRVYRDVPSWSFFLAALGAILLFPVFYWWRQRTFEYHRWLESDHPMKPLIPKESDDD